jgi:hypothetical protein
MGDGDDRQASPRLPSPDSGQSETKPRARCSREPRCYRGNGRAVPKLSLERILTAECPAGIDAGKAERTRSVKLLRAFNVFVERCWLDPRAIKARARLFNLATAIEQLNDGVTHPMLMKETRLGPKNDRHDVWNARKYVCAALECYVRGRKLLAQRRQTSSLVNIKY